MIRNLTIERFKSLVKLELELGRINVFVGANGSGKSNLLEAVGVLGAAAFGLVDDETLQRRGVRPGVPQLYRTAFPQPNTVQDIDLAARSDDGASLRVTLWNPNDDLDAPWSYKTEKLMSVGDRVIASRSPASAQPPNPNRGWAALKTVEEQPGDPAVVLMELLSNYAIYCPNTPSLRGMTQDQQSRDGSGLEVLGRLADARRARIFHEIARELLERLYFLLDSLEYLELFYVGGKLAFEVLRAHLDNAERVAHAVCDGAGHGPDRGEAIFLEQLGLHLRNFAFEVVAFKASPHGGAKQVAGKWFGDVVVGAGLHRFNGGSDGAKSRHDNDVGGGVVILDLLDELNAIHARHGEIGENEIEPLESQHRQRFFAAVTGFHLMTVCFEKLAAKIA